MSQEHTIALLDNLSHIDLLQTSQGYEVDTARYSAAVGGNSGNLAFVHGTKRSIQNKITRINWGWSGEAVRQKASIVVVCCANQIGAHVDLSGWAGAIARFDLPVVLVGLGAQTPNYEERLEVPAGTISFLNEVKARSNGKSPNICVRGEFTQRVLADLGFESVPAGCPSLFISKSQRLGQEIFARQNSLGGRFSTRVAVAAGNPHHAANRAAEPTLMRLCDEYGGAYVVQHPDALIAYAIGDRNYSSESLETCASLLGFQSADECRIWFERNAYSFHDPEVWMHFMRHYDGVIGARYHGVALGVQAGVPGLAVHIDNRTSELCKTTGIPSIPVADVTDMSSQQLLDKLAWTQEVAHAFDENRRLRARMMRDFLVGNNLVPAPHLEDLTHGAH